MTGPHFAQSLIRTCAFTYRRAAARLSDTEFLSSESHGISMAWTLLHITGQLEWAVKLTNNQPTVHDDDFLSHFKGLSADPDSALMFQKEVSRLQIEAMFNESVERASTTLDATEPRWLSEPYDGSATAIFPTVAAIWKHVGFHMSWHLGQLSLIYPQLEGPIYSEPPLRGYVGGGLS